MRKPQQNKSIKLGGTLICSLAALVITLGCQKNPEIQPLKVGESVNILPSPKAASGDDEKPAMILNITVNKKSLDQYDDAEIVLYGNGQSDPKSTILWQVLMGSAETTGCNSFELEALAKRALPLICDNSFSLDDIQYLEVKVGDKTYSATSWGQFMANTDVVEVKIEL